MDWNASTGSDYYDLVEKSCHHDAWEELAPDIVRQRMIVEGTLHNLFLPEDMTTYCNEITKVLDMTPVTSPICSHEPGYGWCAYMHWKESGMHIYSWNDRIPKFFSVDIYTCKKFDYSDVIRYNKEFFGDNLIKITWKK